MAHNIDEDKWEDFTKHVANVYSRHDIWYSIDDEIAIAIGGYVKTHYRVTIRYIFLYFEELHYLEGDYSH